MRKRTSLIVAAGITFLVLAVIVAYILMNQHPNARAAEVPSAKVAAAMRGDIARTLSLAGQFQPYQVVDVHPKVSGFMVKINVDIGDRVRKGQTLAVLEVPELTVKGGVKVDHWGGVKGSQ
jgi:multidrug efflux pump subunit AcrA (membrane-fusion protein)